MKTINHKELKRMIKTAYNKKMALFIWGTMGIGKSESVRETAQHIATDQKLLFLDGEHDGKTHFGFIDVRISQLEPSDLRGLPSIKDGVTKWLPPSWLPSNKESKGILFFDELNLAPPSIQASCYQLILDRRIGDYKLPDGWIIISAGNTLSDKANVFELPSPLANRFIHTELKIPSVKEYTIWGLEHGVDANILSFLEFKPSYLYKFDRNNKDKAFPTPRSNFFASKLIKGCERDYDELEILISSAVGEAYATEYIAFLRLQDKIDLTEILNKPESVKDIKEIDLRYSLLGMVTERYKSERKILEKCLKVAINLDAEFSILLLRFLKDARKDFKEDAVKSALWQDIVKKYWNIFKEI